MYSQCQLDLYIMNQILQLAQKFCVRGLMALPLP